MLYIFRLRAKGPKAAPFRDVFRGLRGSSLSLSERWKLIGGRNETNLFNDYIYAEPIFPWRARFFEFGVKARIF